MLNTSEQLAIVDDERDGVFRGLSDTVKANLNHRNKAKKDAATRLSILFNQYGTAAYEPFVKEYNTRVEKYENTLAVRKGRSATKTSSIGLN